MTYQLPKWFVGYLKLIFLDMGIGGGEGNRLFRKYPLPLLCWIDYLWIWPRRRYMAVEGRWHKKKNCYITLSCFQSF